MNTKGSGHYPSDFAVVHSDEGRFVQSQVRENGKITFKLRLLSGGHGQNGLKLLNKHGISYKIIKTYPNGVRIGRVLDHKRRKKRLEAGQSWFPESWTPKDIRKAGEHVSGLRKNRHVPDGTVVFGTYKGVRVGVIRDHGHIATIFPDIKQPTKNIRGKFRTKGSK